LKQLPDWLEQISRESGTYGGVRTHGGGGGRRCGISNRFGGLA